MRATRAYLAGFGTAGSLVAGAALLFVLGSAIVAFRGWPQIGAAPATTVVAAARVAPPSHVTRRLTALLRHRTSRPSLASRRSGGRIAHTKGAFASRPGSSRGGASVQTAGAGAGSGPSGPGASGGAGSGAPSSSVGCGSACGQSASGSVIAPVTDAVSQVVSDVGTQVGGQVSQDATSVAGSASGTSPQVATAVQDAGNTAGSAASSTATKVGGAVGQLGNSVTGH